jgi:hypothetical protein
MVLRVTNLNTWIHKDFMRDFYYKGIESLSKVYLKLVKQTTVEIIIKPLTPSPTAIDSDCSSYLDELFEDDEQNEEVIKEKEANLRYQTVQLEVDKLGKILLENKYQIKESNSQFWRNHERLLPKLFKLATILLNIQSSSAFVERFFSICGIICKKRASNMKNKLIIMRSMMKANFHLLNELNEQC